MGLPYQFVQDNHSRSTQGILRGLHYQTEHAQGKLVRVTRGEVFDDYPQCVSHDGKRIVFIASRIDNAEMSQFQYGALGEIYSVGVEGGREKQ